MTDMSYVIISSWCNVMTVAALDRYWSVRDGEEQWIQGGGWAAWAASAPEPPRAGSEVDHIRAELRTELRSALRHAYLGPKYAPSTHRYPS